jgi:prepilin-type processing-associated H-X9-DG protein
MVLSLQFVISMLALLTALLSTVSPLETSPVETLIGAPPLLTAEGQSIGIDGRPVEDHPFLGIIVEGGIPDGLSAGVEVSPLSFMRLHLAAVSNGVGLGVRVGLALVAFPRFPIRPMIAFDAGYVFSGTGAWALQFITDPTLRSALSAVNAGFVDGHVGLEFGSKHFSVVLRGGLSYVDVDLGGHTFTTGANSTLTAGGTSLRGFIPSARLGLQVCF